MNTSLDRIDELTQADPGLKVPFHLAEQVSGGSAVEMTRIGAGGSKDPRPGGLFRVTFGSGFSVRGAYVEVDPPRRVVYTWGWEAAGAALPPGGSTVEVTLTPDGDETVLRLTHRGLPAELRDVHGHGWDHFLSRLATAAAGGDPGPDPMASAENMA